MKQSDTDQANPVRTGHDTVADDRGGFAPLGTIRTAVAGVLMGIANLIPGVSGGTMILAVGLYEEFIDSVADVTALRFRRRRIVFLAVLVGFALVSIVALSHLILYLLLWHNSLMFALFIGLTLGGTPVLVRLIGHLRAGVVVAALAGLAVMAGIAMFQVGTTLPRNHAMDVVSGLVGSTTMVLPGISGSYMLLVLNQYDRVVGAVADLRDGATSAAGILIPVGIGVVIGIVGLSNLLKVLLHRYEKVTLGFLLGMLLGSVLGLWPFGRTPTEKILSQADDVQLREFATMKGVAGSADLEGDALIRHIRNHWSSRTASDYTPREVSAAAAALAAGFVTTTLLGRLGAARKPR
ncbi:MAG: DUF368 domain-containing protein [Phycisphaerales bacterium]|nr:MAG: DUF368 domain-containing protein [Phycisphaerales bacterium]